MTAQTLPLPVATPAPTTDEQRSGWSWGHFPYLALTVAIGVALVAAGNAGAETSAWWAQAAFYLGLLAIVLPAAIRLLSKEPEGTERVSIVILVACGLMVCKFLHDPVTFDAFDEYLHWRTAQDIAQTGVLFTPNTLLPVSPFYPGLELATNALSTMSGMPIFESGMLVLFAARIIFMGSLFFFLAMVSGSARVAGVACLIDMANPKFLLFNAEFAYESLALPLAALVLYLIARRGHSSPARWLGLTVLALVTLPTVVLTHHVTSAMLAIFLILWAVCGYVLRRRDRSKPGRIAVLLGLLITGWIVFVATATIGYLGPALASTLTSLVKLMAGHVEPRELFTAPTGDVAPLWERLTGTGSAGLIMFLLPLGLFVVWFRYRKNPAVVALALASLAYPFTLVARFTSVGAEVAARTPEFLFIGIGLVLALALVRLSFAGRRGIFQSAAVGAVICVLVIGGVIVGQPGWARLPGPYLPSADGRSIETEGISAATWTRGYLGEHNPFVADRVNQILMATYGRQDTVNTYHTRLPVRRLYLAPAIGPTQRQIVRDGGIKYLVVDRRLTTGPPTVGHYFDRGETRLTGGADTALDPQLLAKFDQQLDVSRIFDSGNIQLYNVMALGQTS
jgi:hypothetical protein